MGSEAACFVLELANANVTTCSLLEFEKLVDFTKLVFSQTFRYICRHGKLPWVCFILCYESKVGEKNGFENTMTN